MYSIQPDMFNTTFNFKSWSAASEKTYPVISNVSPTSLHWKCPAQVNSESKDLHRSPGLLNMNFQNTIRNKRNELIIHVHFVDGNKEFGSKCRWMQRLKFIDVPAHAPCFTWKTTNTYRNHCFTRNNTVVQLSWAYLRPTIRTFLWNCSNFATFKIIISPNRPRSSPVNAMAGQQLCQVNGSCKESTKQPSMTRDFRLFFPPFFNSKYVHVAIHTNLYIFIYNWIFLHLHWYVPFVNKILWHMDYLAKRWFLLFVSNHQNKSL